MAITVLLADDHQILREGLKSLINKHQDMEVVATVGDGLEAVNTVMEKKPDVAVMDIHMPNLNGIEATRRITEAGAGTRVVALSMYPKKRFVTEMLKAGAKGYILKDCAFEELTEAIKEVMQGRVYLSREISDVVIKEFVQGLSHVEEDAQPLTSREREVLQRLAEGQSAKEIAYDLGLSGKTVDVHKHNMMRKLNLNNMADLVKYAISEGLTDL